VEYVLIAAVVLLLVLLGAFALPGVICPWLEKKAWLKLAARTGLTYVSRSFLGIPKRGRITGTYRGHDLTLDTYKYLGIDLYMRIVLSVSNRAGGSLLVLGKPFGNQSSHVADTQFDQFLISESQPEDFVAEVFASTDLRQGFQDAVQGIGPGCYYVEVSGHILRFEHQPRWHFFRGVDRKVDRLQSLFDVLCDVAEAVDHATR